MKRAIPADPTEASIAAVSQIVKRSTVRAGSASEGVREVAEETAVALTYNGGTQAVMMATPDHLEDFAVGFSLTERIVAAPGDIESIDIVPATEGLDVQMWLAGPRAEALSTRRRNLAGPTGCGLCGVDSLAEAMRDPPKVFDVVRIDRDEVAAAIGAIGTHQALHRQTGAVHAAAFWRREHGVVCLREDVGRHNALDKLVGALARRGESGRDGVLLLTSRVSVEMVQKAAVLGAEVMVAVSAPTALAIRTADAAGITLVAVARADGFEVFTHPHRVSPGPHRPDPSACGAADPEVCGPEAGDPLLPVEEALRIVVEDVSPIAGNEDVPLVEAIGRMSAKALTTPWPLPRFDHSAMDGYGIAASDCGRQAPFRLKLVGSIAAGGSASVRVEPGEAVRILTGAPVPEGVAAVVMQEHCRVAQGELEVRRSASQGMNIRVCGEDADTGSLVAPAGSILSFAQIPVLAACGVETLRVRRRIRVAILSTGDELAAADGQPGASTVPDVNRSMLMAVLAQPWIDTSDLGMVRDDTMLIARILSDAAALADLIVTSGGVSGSDADCVASAIAVAGGHSRVLRVAIRPGKPLLVGRIAATPVLGLPGNPLAALANMLLFGRPLIQRRTGRPLPPQDRRAAMMLAPPVGQAGRTHVIPATCGGQDSSGRDIVSLSKDRGSARIFSLGQASGLAVVPPVPDGTAARQQVSFIPFDRLWT